jgi:PqqD family protein of HPr-rel-A system
VSSSSTLHVPEPLRWREFDGSWVVYQTRSGAIAHLDHLSATVLSLLEVEPLTLADLAAQLAAETALTSPDELSVAVEGAAESLRRAGFIAAADGPPAW